MIDVTPFIRELLFSHDCVILPSFGGFIGNYTPAVIERGSNTFSPPRKAISFNRNLNQNDGLLISVISAARGIGYADSRRIVEEFVQGVRERLSKGERVTFDLIGTFRNNGEGNVIFEPDGSTNFLLDSYGLPVFRREPVEGYDVSSRIMARNNRGSERVISRKMIWRAAVALPFIATMIIVPLKSDLFRNNASLNPLVRTQLTDMQGKEEGVAGENSEIMGVAGSETETAGMGETALMGGDEVIQQVTATGTETAGAKGNDVVAATVTGNEGGSESAVSSTTKSQVEGETELSDKRVSTIGGEAFQVITGSFQAKDNAVRQQQKLISQGYSASVTAASNGYYRVSAVSYGSYQEADSARRAISGSFPGTWILRR